MAKIEMKGIMMNGMPIEYISGDSDSITLTCDTADIFSTFNGYWYRQETKEKLPKRYIINKGATILFWNDDETDKTIVKRCKEDEFNKRLGFLTAYFQYHSGLSKTQANKYLSELEVEDY